MIGSRARTLKDRRRRSAASLWRWGFGVAAVACLASYVVGATLWEVTPGSPVSISYGIAATVFLVGAALYGARRRLPGVSSRRGLGRSRGWLYFHLYGGSLFLLLMLLHTGFRLPMGGLNVWLFVLSLWTAASGLVGLLLQQWLPKVLASGLSLEVNYDRIPELAAEIRERAEELAAGCDDSVRALYAKKIAPVLAAPRRRLLYFIDVTGGIQTQLKEFRYLAGRLEPAERNRLEALEKLYRAKLEIDAHYTLQHALRVWLYGHVPPSLLLIALVALHVFTVLYY